jgi:hypothetical protein
MRFTAVVNLVIVLALAVGTAGLPGLPGQSPDPMFTGPSLFFPFSSQLPLTFLSLDSSIELGSAGTTDP